MLFRKNASMVAAADALARPHRPDDAGSGRPLRQRPPARPARGRRACRPPCSPWAASGVSSASSGNSTACTRRSSATQAATPRTPPTRRSAPASPVTPRPSSSSTTPRSISYERLLQTFWEEHDPTQGMRQGNDVGSQYRSAIFVTDASQQPLIEASRAMFQERLTAAGYGEITSEVAAARPRDRVLLRRAVPPAVPGQEPQRVLRRRRHRCQLPDRPRHLTDRAIS